MMNLQPSYYEVLILDAAERAAENRSIEDQRVHDEVFSKIYSVIFLALASCDVVASIVIQQKTCDFFEDRLTLYPITSCVKLTQLTLFLIGVLGLLWAGLKKQIQRDNSMKLSVELCLFVPLHFIPISLSFIET